jgi:hypothetical protein
LKEPREAHKSMATDFDAGMEESFTAFRAEDGEKNITFNGNPIPAIVNEFTRRTEVGVAGVKAVFAGSISLLAADWSQAGMKVGSVVTLPGGRRARVESEPFIDAEPAGVIDVALIAE